jgi:hypothetical protein
MKRRNVVTAVPMESRAQKRNNNNFKIKRGKIIIRNSKIIPKEIK